MSVNQITDAPSNAIRPQRRRLPDERRAITHHFSVGGQEGYVTVGLYEDGQPGELFIKMSKEGSTVSGLMDSFATAVPGPAIWSSASSTVRQVQSHAFRTQRMDRQCSHRLR